MSDPRAPQDDDYSATVLGSHWISGPPVPQPAVPDRVEGSVMRFGPGVTAALPAPFPVSAVTVPRRRPGAGLRRYALAAVVLAAVLAYLGWQRFGPALEVREVAVATDPKGPSCDSTADVVAVVRTNGRPGTLTYRWLRSDGTRSEQLTERVPRGGKEARLHLLWTFQGAGTYPAKAELELVSPERHTASVEFTYRCSR
uniref:Ig-like domain-containing protein n=1 Tax=Streptomyces sp. NBC_00049 TaxID=2903617 RepID=A0AAU2JHM3_9ACTN